MQSHRGVNDEICLVLGVLLSRFYTVMVGVRLCLSQAEMATPSQGDGATAGSEPVALALLFSPVGAL